MRFIEDQIPRAGSRFTLTWRALPTLSVGVEYNPRADMASPLANWLAVEETAKRPALIVGSSSDRIGTPSGQSFYATFSKNLKRETHLPIAPYAGVAYGTYEDEWQFIGGMSLGFTEQTNLLFVHDGVNSHLLFNASWKRHTVSLLYVDFEDLGVSYSVAF